MAAPQKMPTPWEHPQYGNRYEVRYGSNTIVVWAWSRKNARSSGARKLGTKPDRVFVSQAIPPLQTTNEEIEK